jgi:hypothetical protein
MPVTLDSAGLITSDGSTIYSNQWNSVGSIVLSGTILYFTPLGTIIPGAQLSSGMTPSFNNGTNLQVAFFANSNRGTVYFPPTLPGSWKLISHRGAGLRTGPNTLWLRVA